MTDRRFYPGYRARQRRRDLLESIKKLEQWHRIFDEWAIDHNDWPNAVEMANQGLTYISWILNQYYLPGIISQLETKSLLELPSA